MARDYLNFFKKRRVQNRSKIQEKKKRKRRDLKRRDLLLTAAEKGCIIGAKTGELAAAG